MNVFSSADTMFLGMLKECIQAPPVPSRNGPMHEVYGWSGRLHNSRARRITFPERNVRPGYPQASVAWNLAEKNDVDSICWWNPHGRKISDDGLTFYGANYGERWSPYLDEAIYLLRTNPDTRRAWVPIWKPEDLVGDRVEYVDTVLGNVNEQHTATHYSREGKDVPCTLGFGLALREDKVSKKLHMNVVMRSQAVWGVFPYDVYLLSVMHELVANDLEAELGEFIWTVQSMHVFEREIPFITKLFKADPPASLHGLDDPIRLTLDNAKVQYPMVLQMAMSGHPIDTYGLGLQDDPVVNGMIEGAAQIRRAEGEDGA